MQPPKRWSASHRPAGLAIAIGAAGLLTIATGLSLVPALRAMRVDPVSVLRVE